MKANEISLKCKYDYGDTIFRWGHFSFVRKRNAVLLFNFVYLIIISYCFLVVCLFVLFVCIFLREREKQLGIDSVLLFAGLYH